MKNEKEIINTDAVEIKSITKCFILDKSQKNNEWKKPDAGKSHWIILFNYKYAKYI